MSLFEIGTIKRTVRIMRQIFWLSLSILVVLFLTGCTIEEYIGAEEGDLYISAVDDSGNVLIGADIYLNGDERNEITPDTLKNVEVGIYLIRVELYGYVGVEDSVEVEADTVTSFEATLVPSNMGAISVDVIGGPAMLIIDGITLDWDTTEVFDNIPVGTHDLSVFRDGYFTSPDTLVPVNVVWQETTQVDVSFELTEGAIGVAAGNVCPDFTLQNDNLDSVSLHNYRGRIILVDFWYVDCYFCVLEFPHFEEFYHEFNPWGFQILAVDPYDALLEIIEFRDEMDLTFQLLMDPEHEVEQMFGVTIYPANFFIDGSGEVRYVRGHITYDEMESLMIELYGGRP